MKSPKHRVLVWELVALIAVFAAVAHVSVPLLDGLFLQRQPGEIVVRVHILESGGFEPDRIFVKKGETVRLVLMSMDATHSFNIPGLNITSGNIAPGHKKVIEFTPSKTGFFEFRCTVFCSLGHRQLRGELVVYE